MTLRPADTRIICVGNRFLESDALGPRVFDRLSRRPLPPGVEVVNGGLQELNLLGAVEGCRRVIFVDSVTGFGAPGSVMVLPETALTGLKPLTYGHAGGLSYLLHVLPAVCERPLPEVWLVAVESPPGAGAVEAAIEACLSMS